jgi:CBS domain-containing protein
VANYDLTARDIMQVEIAAILGDATIVDAAAQMRYEGVRSLLIVPRNPSDPYAIITFSDIVNQVLAHGHDPAMMQVHEVMTKPLITVPPDMRVEYIARLFQQSKIGHVPVMDCGELLGIVSMTDLVTEVITERA